MNREKEKLIQEIIKAGETGTFLEYIYKASLSDQPQGAQIDELLISVHNRGELDIINEFKQLKNQPDSGQNFFLTRGLFEKTLPHLNAPILPVMECVLHLLEETGEDLSVGKLFPPFAEFCEAESSRSSGALEYVLASPDQWSDLLSPILVTGTSNDMDHFFQQAMELSFHENVAIRRSAVHSLGIIQFPAESEYIDRAMNCFVEVTKKESDDQVLGRLVKATYNLCLTDNCSQADTGIEIIKSILSKGKDHTLLVASEIFGYEVKKLPEKMLDVLLPFLLNVDPKHTGTLSCLGYGITTLLKRDDPTKGIEFLENLLMKHRGNLTIESLDISHSIHDQKEPHLLNKLMTRWFLNGNPFLCNSISSILNKIYADDLQLEIDPTEISLDDPDRYLFIARKAIGFLFIKPVTCTSIILSLMRNTQNDGLIHDLSELLFDPILLNFSGKPYDFLKKKKDNLTEPAKNAVQKAIDAIDDYLGTLMSMPDIAEMYPPQEHREAKIRRHNQIMAESYKDAKKGSIMDLICSNSVLLYGNTSIMHIQDSSGKSSRMEIPMQHHGVSIELPRQADIDPFGLDHTLHIFRNERLTNR